MITRAQAEAACEVLWTAAEVEAARPVRLVRPVAPAVIEMPPPPDAPPGTRGKRVVGH